MLFKMIRFSLATFRSCWRVLQFIVGPELFWPVGGEERTEIGSTVRYMFLVTSDSTEYCDITIDTVSPSSSHMSF